MRHTDATPGWIKRRFAKIEKWQREQAAARRMEAATIGKGGVTIKGGGSLRMKTTSGADAVVMLPFSLSDGSGEGFQFVITDELGNPVFVTTRYETGTVPPNGDTSLFLQGDRVVTRSKSGESEFWMDDTQTYVNAGNNKLHLWANDGVTIQYTNTAAAANCFIDPSDGRIWRSTSSARRKVDIEDVEIDPAAVLKMQGRTFRDKGQVEADPDTQTRYVGFVAEELHELGLTQFVDYDDEGRPDAISYDRLSVALLAVLKDQQARIEALESANEAPAEP